MVARKNHAPGESTRSLRARKLVERRRFTGVAGDSTAIACSANESLKICERCRLTIFYPFPQDKASQPQPAPGHAKS